MKQNKQHWWMASVRVTAKHEDKVLFVGETTFSTPKKYVSNSTIEAIRDSTVNKVKEQFPLISSHCHILSISYLGEMTKGEFYE